MEEVFRALEALRAKTLCFPDSQILSILQVTTIPLMFLLMTTLQPVTEAIHGIESEMGVREVRLRSGLNETLGEIEHILRAYGLSFVPFGVNGDCRCMACLQVLTGQASLDLCKYLTPVPELTVAYILSLFGLVERIFGC